MVPEVEYGLYGVALADGPALSFYDVMDRALRRIDSATGDQVRLVHPGPPGRSGDLHKGGRDDRLQQRDREDAEAFAVQAHELGEANAIADLSEEVQVALGGVLGSDLPAIIVFLPAESPPSERVTIRIPAALTSGVQNQRDLIGTLVKYLAPDAIAKSCPPFPFPGTPEQTATLRAYLEELERRFQALAGRRAVDPSAVPEDLSSKWLVFTGKQGEWVSASLYASLRERLSEFEIFADQSDHTVWHDGEIVRGRISDLQFRLLRECARSRALFDPTTYGDPEQDSVKDPKQLFQRARGLVDRKRDGAWALFRSVLQAQRSVYQFDPHPDLQFALVFRDDD